MLKVDGQIFALWAIEQGKNSFLSSTCQDSQDILLWYFHSWSKNYETSMVSLFQILSEFLILFVIYNAVPSLKALYKLHIPSLCFVYDVSIMCMSCNLQLLIRLVSNIIFPMLLNFPPVWVDTLGGWQQAPATIRGRCHHCLNSFEFISLTLTLHDIWKRNTFGKWYIS